MGLGLKSDKGKIFLSQNQYIADIQPVVLSKLRRQNKDDTSTDVEQKSLRLLTGQILWASSQTRPDVAFKASCLASNMNESNVQTVLDTNKVVRQWKTESVQLMFQPLGNRDVTKLMIYNDASLGNLPDGGTQGGHVIFLVGEDGRISPLCWQSKKIKRVAQSTLTAETLAMANGTDSAMFLAPQYSELCYNCITQTMLPIECITDSKSLLEELRSNKRPSWPPTGHGN